MQPTTFFDLNIDSSGKIPGIICHKSKTIKSCIFLLSDKANLDVWMHNAVKPDGTMYYEYVLCYVDDVMVIGANQNKVIEELQEHFVLKEVTNPGESRQCYLGDMIGKYTFKDGSTGWYMLANEYLVQAIPMVEAEWDEKFTRKLHCH